MLYINKERALPGPVHLGQLAEVLSNHMPAQVVRFASPSELERVATEVSRERPELLEEVHFVRFEELARRERLAKATMQVLEGSQRNA
jgi:hypothetical protein